MGTTNQREAARAADDKHADDAPVVDGAAPKHKMSAAEVKADNATMVLDLRVQETQKRMSDGKRLEDAERTRLVTEIEEAKQDLRQAQFGLPKDSSSLANGRRAIAAADTLLQQLDPVQTKSRETKAVLPDTKAPASVPNGPTDPLLFTETRDLQFPKTVVGRSSTRAVVVRNDDVRPMALDAIVPIRLSGGAASEGTDATSARAGQPPMAHADAFHEVRPLLNGTLLLQPGERREIAIEFRPKRAMAIEQVLQLVTGFGPVGPEGDIHVTGEGIDLPYDGTNDAEQPDSARSSTVGTEVRIDEQRQDVAGAARTHDQLAKQRAQATMLVEQWRSGTAKFSHSLAQWTLANWIDYLGKTGGDHVLHGSAEVMDGWKKAVNRTAKIAVKMGRRSASKALGLQHPILRQGFEEVFDKIGDFVLDKMGLKDEDPVAKSDAHALEATQSTGKAGVKKTDEIFAYEARAGLSIEDTASAAELAIARAESAEDLAQWAEWARAEMSELPKPVDAANRDFSDALLQQWVLEHAGTPDHANASTNQKAWNAARDELKTKGKLESLERTDLFVHQCRHEWGYLGLTDAEQVALQLDVERRRFEAQARAHPNTDEAVAAQVRMGIDGNRSGRLVSFARGSDPKQLATAFGKHDYLLGMDGDAPGLRVFGSTFTLDCNVVLEASAGGVFVKTFWYDVIDARGQRHDKIQRNPGEP
jgi:hypothetical protein